MLLRDIERRTAADRGLRPGDGDVLLEHEPALVPRVVEELDDLVDPRVSLARAAGTGPACVGLRRATARRCAARSASVASTSLRWTWPMRSACSRTNCAGSTPPISRWPVSKHQRDVGVLERALDVRGRSRATVPTCGCSDELEALRGGDVGELGAGARPRASSRRRRAATGADHSRSCDRRGDEHARRRPAASCAAARRACSRVAPSVRLVDDDAGRSRRPAAGRSGRARRGPRAPSSGSQPSGPELGRGRGRARPSRPARARAAAAGPSRGPRRRPTRSGRPPAGTVGSGASGSLLARSSPVSERSRPRAL